jgi:hypothetical protein
MRLTSTLLLLLIASFFCDNMAWARSDDMKKPCVNCHTMHNSQSGNVIPGNTAARGALLNNSCYGCHTGVNTGSTNAAPKAPKVLHLSPALPPSAPYKITGTEIGHDTLAGGDFGWVAIPGNDLKGHNVEGIAPGATLTCAGSTGCHGNSASIDDLTAMYQTHHAVETAQPMDGSPLNESYRLLDSVAGYEDPDYELSVSSADHNQYKGIARNAESDNTSSSISNFCARCHGNFHTGSNPSGISNDSSVFGVDPWIRHPTDYAMVITGDYANYGGAGNAYNVATPLGSSDVSAPKTTVSGPGDSVLVCVSCHRAHGSPYDYSLRWDYKDWPGGANAYNGCGDCHTALN